MIKRLNTLFVFIVLGLPLQAIAADSRFQIQVLQDSEATTLDTKKALQLALPTLWKRVVPSKDFKKAMRLHGRTSLVLRFKPIDQGLNLVFNPVQVQSYLKAYGVHMIAEQPKWNLSIFVLGFSDEDESIAQELMDYSYTQADELGFELTTQGRKLQLIFAPVVDEYSQTWVHVDMQGAFPNSLLSQRLQLEQGYISNQLQVWLDQILREVRDAYSEGLVFQEASTEVLLTIESEFSLATQVMLEQTLENESAVLQVIPTMLQKLSRQYRLILRDEDDSWLEPWFASYGMIAVRQPEGSASQWLVQ